MKPWQYWILSAILSFGLVGIEYWASDFGWFEFPPLSAWVVSAVALVTALVYQLTVIRQRRQPDSVASFLLMMITTKFMLLALVAWVVIQADPLHGHAHAVVFLGSYFVFTPLLIGALIRRF
ncbi:MAG: hypothetical protein K1X47_09495 [Cyclobacteriaceae bacterium]|nr:hypothetical protein [Cyclobacteriaceae bacterium]